MPRLYLSFAPPDREFAAPFSDLFREWGMDVEDTGESFSQQAIEDANALILILSPLTAASDRVNAEVGWALQAHKPILSVMVEKTTVLPFPFVINEPHINYAADPMAVLKRFASALGYRLADPYIPPELPARRKNTKSVEEPLRLDHDHASALFFAATEYTENQPEKAIFLFKTLTRLAPDYADEQLDNFINAEITRLQLIRLQDMKDALFTAVRQKDLPLAGQILRAMQAQDAEAAPTQAAADHLLHAQIESFSQQIKKASSEGQWEDVEVLIQAVANLDAEHSDSLRREARQAYLTSLEANAETAIRQKQWEQADKFIQEIGRLDFQRSEAARQKFREAQIGWQEDLASTAINEKRWEQADKIIQELGGLDTQRSETARQKFREAQIGWQEDLASAAIREEQWETAEDFIKDISTLDGEESPALRDLRLATLERLGLVFVEKEQFERAEALAQHLLQIAPDNPHSAVIETYIEEAKFDSMLDKAESALSGGRWAEAMTIAQEVLLREPDHPDAAEIYKTAQDWANANALYQQAVLAAEAGRLEAVTAMIRRVHQIVPNYGDPESLMTGHPLEAALISFVGLVARLEAHPGSLAAMVLSADGAYLATASKSSIIVWELPDFEPVYRFKDPEWVHDLALSPDNSALAVSSTNGDLRIWSLDDGKLAFKERFGSARLAFSPDGRRLAVGNEDGHIVLLSSERWQKIANWWEARSKVNTLVFSPDSSRLAIAQENGGIIIYEAVGVRKNSEQETIPVFSPANQTLIQWSATGLAFINDGDWLLGTSLTAAEGICIWSRTGSIVRKFPAGGADSSVMALSPDERLLVTGGRMGSAINFWDLQTGKLLHSLRNYGRGVYGMAFTPDRLYVLIGDANGNVTFWGVGGTDKPVVYKDSGG